MAGKQLLMEEVEGKYREAIDHREPDADGQRAQVLWLEDVVYQALEPIRIALARAADFHQDSPDVWEDIMVLEQLYKDARAKLKAFEDEVCSRFGAVGLWHQPPRLAEGGGGEILGVRWLPSKKLPDLQAGVPQEIDATG